MGLEVGGLLGFLILVADIWAIFHTIQSSASNAGKALWIALILVLPVLGLILWLIAGPRGSARAKT